MTTHSCFDSLTIQHLRSAIQKFAAQLDKLADADLTILANSRAVNAITRALKDNTRLLESCSPPSEKAGSPARTAPVATPAKTPAEPVLKTPQVAKTPLSPQDVPKANTAHDTISAEPPPPVAPPQRPGRHHSPAGIRKLPEFPMFRKRFFEAWKSRYPGIPRSRANAALQTLLDQLARSPQDPQTTLRHIMRTQTYTEPQPHPQPKAA